MPRRIALTMLALSAATTAMPQDAAPLELAAGVSMSAAVVSMGDGRTLFEYDGDRRLTPASVTKLFTTAAALRTLGPQARLETTFGLRTDTAGRALTISGSFDPTTDSRLFATASLAAAVDTLAAALRTLGIDTLCSVTVDVSLSPEAPYSPKRLWEDMGNYYGAAPTVVMADDNAVDIFFSSPPGVGEECRLDSIVPDIGGLRPQTSVRSYDGKADRCYVCQAGPSMWYATGQIPRGRSAFRVRSAMPTPEAHYAEKVAKLLRAARVGVGQTRTAAEPQSDTTLFTMRSPTIVEIARQTNFHSVNLFADALCLHLGTQGGKRRASWDAGAEAVEKLWKREAGVSPTLRDGSGLSPSNSMSARDVVGMLVSMGSGKERESFMSTLPRMGREGTWSHMGRKTPLAGNVRAKSGTMSGVVSYAGYMTLRSGNEAAFCIIVNHFAESAHTVRRKIVEWLVSTYNSN